MSAAFDHQGRVLATTAYSTAGRQATVAYAPTRGTTTPSDQIGDTFAWLCLAVTSALSAIALTGAFRARAARRARKDLSLAS
ncbi:hypothetical protein [Streptomyces sp. NPDC020362]|uniref:hypothetical protein n=1 Tax=unclassified Streptomyces TaxID=2593676 RepID=UPI0033F83B56